MGLGGVEAGREPVSAPMAEAPEVSDDARKWAERKLAELVEGASIPDQERMFRMLEVVEGYRETLLDLDRETFATLEREWEALRQGLQSGMNMTRGNDEEKLRELQTKMKALGARIDSMRSAEGAGDSYADRAKRYYRLLD